MATAIEKGAVTIKRGVVSERVQCETVLCAAGVQASPLGEVLAKHCGAQLDRGDRIIVEPDLSLPNHPEIFVIGDMANYSHQDGRPLAGITAVAMQLGRYVAERLLRRSAGKATQPFHHNDRSNMAISGRGSAVADLGRIRLAGFGRGLPGYLSICSIWSSLKIEFWLSFSGFGTILGAAAPRA